MNSENLFFKKKKVNSEIDLTKVEDLSKRASDKEYGTNVQKKNDKVIPFYTNIDTYIKLQNYVMSAKLEGIPDETSINKILRKGLELFFREKEERS